MYKIKTPSMKTLFFLKSFFKNFILMMLPLVIVSAYSLYRFHQDTTETIAARNWNLMYQIKTQADSMFQTVDTISTFLSDSSSISNTLQDTFLEEMISSQTSKQVRILSQYLQSIIDSNHFAYSAYIYFDNDFGRYIATSNGNSFIRNFSSDNWLQVYMNSTEDFWYEANQINTYSTVPDKDVIALYKKLFSSQSSRLPRGVLVTYYSLDSIKEYISKFELYPGQKILFLPKGESPLFQNSAENFTDIWDQIALNMGTESDYKTFRMEYGGNSYITAVLPAVQEELYYVSLIPVDVIYNQTQNLTFVYVLIAVAACILSICLSLINARQDYNQLQNIIDTFNNVDKNLSVEFPPKLSHINSPYQLILYNVINLFLEKRYLKLQVDNKQYQMEVLEMKALQYQINPHFLFNTLHMIYWEAIRLTNSPNTCSTMISDLSEVVSYALIDAHKKVRVSEELKYLEHYTNIQEMRYDHKFQIIWDIDEVVYDMTIIKMVLQPLIENCIYHGIKPVERQGIIKIKMYHRDHKIVVHILDNGAGIPKNKLEELRSSLLNTQETLDHIGLINTNRRLVLTYGDTATIRITSRYHAGTIISFSIPAEKDPI